MRENRSSTTTEQIGSRPRGATPEGLLDMAGSLLEWTSTLDRRYPYRADDGRDDQSLPGERIVRVVRHFVTASLRHPS